MNMDSIIIMGIIIVILYLPAEVYTPTQPPSLLQSPLYYFCGKQWCAQRPQGGCTSPGEPVREGMVRPVDGLLAASKVLNSP